MKTLHSSWCLPFLLGAALVAVPVRSARASDFHVNPVRIDLDEKTRTGLISIDNPGPEPLRLQVSVFAWTQDAQGKVQLTPTRDLTYFPSLLTVEPGESRNIRVGGQLPVQSTERTYRLIVEQLPPAVTQSSVGTQIRMLTRMSIPLFVAPSERTPRGNVAGLALSQGTLSFALRNEGNTHVFAKKARVQARDAHGETVLDQEQAGWYVLAGGERRFTLPIPRELCPRLHSVSVEVTTDSGSFPATATLPGNGCGS